MEIIYDNLKLYFKEDYIINDKIILKQPTIGEIVKFGEEKYYLMAQTLSSIPSDMKSALDDMGIDYEEISDFELFIILSKGLKKEATYLLLGDLELSAFEIAENKENGQAVLYDFNNDIMIDEIIYHKIVGYIRKLHNFKPKIEKSANKFTKKILIDEDREKKLLNKNKQYKSILLPLISSMVNSPGFKYNSQEVLNIGLYEFMDSVQRISLIRNVDSLMFGVYSGNVDNSKLNKKETDWTRRLD